MIYLSLKYGRYCNNIIFFTIRLKLDFSFSCIFDLIKMNPVAKAKWRRAPVKLRECGCRTLK